jgi:hypothetical protein
VHRKTILIMILLIILVEASVFALDSGEWVSLDSDTQYCLQWQKNADSYMINGCRVKNNFNKKFYILIYAYDENGKKRELGRGTVMPGKNTNIGGLIGMKMDPSELIIKYEKRDKF